MGAIQALRQVNSNWLTLKAFAVVAIQLQPIETWLHLIRDQPKVQPQVDSIHKGGVGHREQLSKLDFTKSTVTIAVSKLLLSS